jgi:hypothetical protein
MVSLALQTRCMVEAPCIRGVLLEYGMLNGVFLFGPERKEKKKEKKKQGMKSVKTTSGGHSNLQPTQGRRCHHAKTRGDDASLYSDSMDQSPWF